MSNEKLREALQLCRAALDNLGLAATLRKYAIRTADEALATTETEPTGMPEVKPWDHPEPQTMRWSDLEIRWIHSYGEQCWKAGYKHGAWGGDARDAKRYRCIRRGQHVSVINGIGDILRAENLDAAINAAMAKGVKG